MRVCCCRRRQQKRGGPRPIPQLRFTPCSFPRFHNAPRFFLPALFPGTNDCGWRIHREALTRESSMAFWGKSDRLSEFRGQLVKRELRWDSAVRENISAWHSDSEGWGNPGLASQLTFSVGMPCCWLKTAGKGCQHCSRQQRILWKLTNE